MAPKIVPLQLKLPRPPSGGLFLLSGGQQPLKKHEFGAKLPTPEKGLLLGLVADCPSFDLQGEIAM
jgi:hypothetical protein